MAVIDEKVLWASADKLRGSIGASDYMHIVLGLIFLKYISDRFEENYAHLVEEGDGFENDKDEYIFEHIFWVLKKLVGIMFQLSLNKKPWTSRWRILYTKMYCKIIS